MSSWIAQSFLYALQLPLSIDLRNLMSQTFREEE